jgi:hypothetical protein
MMTPNFRLPVIGAPDRLGFFSAQDLMGNAGLDPESAAAGFHQR